MASSKKVLAGMVAGALVGVMAGILFAPKSGKVTRKELKRVSDRVGKEIIKRADKFENLTEEKYHQILEEVSGVVRKAKKMKAEDLQEIIDDFKKRWPVILKQLKK